jgi:hypothetical protein
MLTLTGSSPPAVVIFRFMSWECHRVVLPRVPILALVPLTTLAERHCLAPASYKPSKLLVRWTPNPATEAEGLRKSHSFIPMV